MDDRTLQYADITLEPACLRAFVKIDKQLYNLQFINSQYYLHVFTNNDIFNTIILPSTMMTYRLKLPFHV